MPAILTTETKKVQETFSSSSVKTGKDFQRILALDALRGFLLVWMTLTHLPTRVSPFSNQVVGYVSAAEGFILMAAVLIGRIQQHAFEKYGAQRARQKLIYRVKRIYGYHIALLAFAFTVSAAAAVWLHRIPLQNLLDFYLAHPLRALIAAPALIYNPPLLDILPMYVIFMLATPVLLAAARRWGWRCVLLGSGAIWLLAQFHLREWLYAAVAHFGFPIPLNETGAFDLFGWQFLWTIGLCLGAAKSGALFSKARIPRWLVVLSAAVALALFFCRHSSFDVFTGPALFDALVNKWRLSILRLIDAAALGVLLLRFGSPLADTRLGRRVAALGRTSLEVFTAHVVFCLVFLGLAAGSDPHFAPWQDPFVLAITLAGLFLVADRVEKRRALAAATAQHKFGPPVHRQPQSPDSTSTLPQESARSLA
jgi:hypothetical protein